MRRPKKEIQLTSYDELLGLEESPEKSMNQVVEIELEKLHPFKNHPFRVSDDEKMAETVESIKNYGVLNPALVRPRSEGGYELISGHRRKRGCELCGKTTMPVLVRNYTDDEAVIIMVDSNIQRENILPSEKAHAYKMKYDAMKHQGSKGEKYTADMVGETAGDSGRTVQRYIRLASLSDGLLEYVDDNKIPMIVGEKLSYLKPQEQEWLLEGIVNSNIFPTKQQAEQLKECSANGKLNQGYIYAVLLKKENSKINVTIPAKKIGNYFPETYSKEQIEEVIFMLLDKWKQNREDVDELVELMIEVMMMPEDSMIRIAGTEKPVALVKSRFMKLNYSHIEYVLFCLNRNTTKVGNIKAYLLTALYNAPVTINSYYQAEVNHDMYGG